MHVLFPFWYCCALIMTWSLWILLCIVRIATQILVFSVSWSFKHLDFIAGFIILHFWQFHAKINYMSPSKHWHAVFCNLWMCFCIRLHHTGKIIWCSLVCLTEDTAVLRFLKVTEWSFAWNCQCVLWFVKCCEVQFSGLSQT